MHTCRFVLVGIGNIGKGFLRILAQKQDSLNTRYDLQLLPVAAVDSSGAALDASGLDIKEILRLKDSGSGMAAYAGQGMPGLSALDALQKTDAGLLIEVSPTNLQDGEPGLSAMSWALSHGMDVVTANKGPLVLAYQRLTKLAEENQASLRFSGAVAGGLPTVNIGQRDLVGAKVLRVEGIFNMTTNYILMRMSEDGLTFEDALAEAQQAGVAEADPTLDIDGWDPANKLIIVANSVLNMPAALQDVSVEGIRGIDSATLQRATEKGRAVKLLATAELESEAKYKLSVRPTEVPLEHPLSRLSKWQMGVVYTTDIMGVITAVIEDEGPTATAAAVLRDVINTMPARS
jgi:homoserine dehydrogenase